MNGTGDADIVITAQENPLTKSYVGTLTVTAKDAAPVKVTLAQLGSNPNMLVSPVSITVSAEKGAAEIEVTANVTYEYSVSEKWLRVLSAENNILKLEIDEQVELESRMAKVVFTGDNGVTDQTVTVTQEGIPAKLAIVGDKTKTLAFDAKSMTIVVESTDECSITTTGGDGWITLPENKTVREGIRYTYSFTLTENSGDGQRKASVTFAQKQFSDLTTTVTVLQNGKATVPEITITNMPEGGFTADVRQWIRINTEVANGENATYAWTLDGETVSKEKDLLHVVRTAGTHTFHLTAKNANGESHVEVPVTVNARTYENNITKVFDLLPAPGQFTNVYPTWNEGNTQEDMNAKALASIRGKGIVSLGGLGGYVVFGFDHVVINTIEEYDFIVLGNAFTGWAEPAIVMVSYDANGNGLPDDEWFEIAGSEFHNPKAFKNYSITYQPVTVNPETNAQEIHWTDNQNQTGIIYQNGYHAQSYYPGWIKGNLTFSGITSLTNAFQSADDGIVTTHTFAFGYVDNCANGLECSKMKLDWAMDKNGDPLVLKGIDFIKVYNPINLVLRAVGEISPEVCGFEEYNLN
jgi:hypothetical protein